jgi:hypothetical protein
MHAAAEASQASSRDRLRSAAGAQEEAARALERIADRLKQGREPRDAESQRLADQRGRVQELRDQLTALTRQLEILGRDQGAQSAHGAQEVARLRDEYIRQLRATRDLLDQLQREDKTLAHGGMGFTFEGQSMTLSAPGTEAFKQDFTKWEQLRKQATQALDRAETSLAQRLQARATRDRLAAGVDGRPPAGYQPHVDSYFKAIAAQKKP